MSSSGFWISSFFLLFTQAAVVNAQTQQLPCPDAIAVIEGEAFSQRILKRVEPIYRQLGCDTEFIAMPGQRALVAFNQGIVDGELMRIHSVATEYQRPFSRSSVPVTSIRTALFAHPQQQGLLPIGYQLGVIWQKRYASQLDNTLQMYSTEALYEAYNRGHIGGFLSHYLNANELLDKHPLSPSPVLEKALLTYPLFHYLGAEFEPLMQRISQILSESVHH